MQQPESSPLTFPLEPEEDIGRAYFESFHQCLDYVDLTFLLSQRNPYDFSCLSHVPAKKHKEQTMRKFHMNYAGTLLEQLFIPAGINAEIQHLPRYLDIPAHRHEFFEVICILKGTCLHTVEEAANTMGPGDITIIPPGVQHHLLGSADGLGLTVKIRRSTFDHTFPALLRDNSPLADYFTRALFAKRYQNSLTFHCREDTVLSDLLLTMLQQQYAQKPYYRNVMEGLLTVFFSYLLQNYEDTIEFSRTRHAPQERMSAVENYLLHNYRTATLESVAAEFYLTPSYLSTVFKEQTGRTFSAALQEIRMERAARYLTETNEKISHICGLVGYSDTTQFIRTFKKYYNMTPRQFRVAHSASGQYT